MIPKSGHRFSEKIMLKQEQPMPTRRDREDAHPPPHGANHAGIGSPVRRKEDARLLAGKGCYSDDVNLPNDAYAIMVRSPHAHARIRAIDATAAQAIPGVLAVLTGRDILADGVKPIPHKAFSYHPAEIPLRNKDDAPIFSARHYPLPVDRARPSWMRLPPPSPARRSLGTAATTC